MKGWDMASSLLRSRPPKDLQLVFVVSVHRMSAMLKYLSGGGGGGGRVGCTMGTFLKFLL